MKKIAESELFKARVYTNGSSTPQPFNIGLDNGDIILADKGGDVVDRLHADDWNLTLGGTNNERVVLTDDVHGHTILVDIRFLSSLASGCQSVHILNTARKLKKGSLGRSLSKSSGVIVIIFLVLCFVCWVGIGFSQMLKDWPSHDTSKQPVQETETREGSIEATDAKRYMGLVEVIIKGQWKPPFDKKENLINLVKFEVSREGKISNIKVAKSSGDKVFDALSVTTLKRLKKLPPLPASLEAPAQVEFGFRCNSLHRPGAHKDEEDELQQPQKE